MNPRWTALIASGVALAFLSGCSESAIDYIVEEDLKATEALTAQREQAQQDSDERYAEAQQSMEVLVSTFTSSMEDGDGDTLSSIVTDDVRAVMESSDTLSAWNGTGEVAVVTDLPDEWNVEPVLLDSSLEGMPDDMSRKDVFGDAEYVPTVGGIPWTDYQFQTFTMPVSMTLQWRIDGGADRCLNVDTSSEQLLITGECGGIFTQPQRAYGFGEDPLALMKVGGRSLPELSQGSAQILVGRYAVSLDPKLGTLVAIDNAAEGTDISEESPRLIASPEVLEKAKDHARSWLNAQVEMNNDDDRCTAFQGGSIEVDGVSTDIDFPCGYYRDHTKDSLDFANLDEVHTVTVNEGDYETKILITFTANGNAPVAQVKQFETGLGNDEYTALKFDQITVSMDVADGEASYSDEGSVVGRGTNF